jgi:hypothetical protein
MTGEADAELASNSGGASSGEGTAIAALDAAEPPQPQPQKGWPSKRLPRDTRYFVMKSFSMRDILISLKKGIWATQSRNEAKLNSAQSVRARCGCACHRPTAPCVPRRAVEAAGVLTDAQRTPRHPRVARRVASASSSSSPSTSPGHSKAMQRWCASALLSPSPAHSCDDSPVCCVRQTSRTGEAKEDDGSAALWTAVDGTQSWGGVFKVARRPARTTACPLLPRHPRPRAHVAWRSP